MQVDEVEGEGLREEVRHLQLHDAPIGAAHRGRHDVRRENPSGSTDKGMSF
jgi:hypothetical protein